MRGRITNITITPLGTAYLLFASILLVYSAFTGSLETAVYASAMAGVVVAMFFWARLSAAASIGGLTIERRIPSVAEGQVFAVTLRVSNETPLVQRVLVEDRIPHGVIPLSPARGKLLLAPRGEAVVKYNATSRVGRRCYGPVSVEASDPLGIFQWRLQLESLGDQCVEARPVPMKGVKAPVRVGLVAGEGEPRVRDRGPELYQLREYVEGDDARLIDWKATARTGRLITRETLAESAGLVRLVVMLDEASLRGAPPNTVFERALRLAAGLAESLIRMGLKVRLLLLEPGGYRIEAVGRGVEGLKGLVAALASAVEPRGVLDEYVSPGNEYTIVVRASRGGRVAESDRIHVLDCIEGGACGGGVASG